MPASAQTTSDPARRPDPAGANPGKERLEIQLPAPLLLQINTEAAKELHPNRSAVIERLLRIGFAHQAPPPPAPRGAPS